MQPYKVGIIDRKEEEQTMLGLVLRRITPRNYSVGRIKN